MHVLPAAPAITARALIVVVATSAAIVAGDAGAAGVYKWTDEKGKVHYGDRPPPTSQKESVEVKSGGATTSAPASDAERAERRRQLLRAFEQDRAERRNKRAAAEAALAKEKQRKRQCAFAREDLERLGRANYIYDYDDKGQRRILSDAERGDYVKKFTSAVKEHCS